MDLQAPPTVWISAIDPEAMVHVPTVAPLQDGTTQYYFLSMLLTYNVCVHSDLTEVTQ